MKIFITGGTGFVGSHLIRHLSAQGHKVTASGTREDDAKSPEPDFTYLQADTTRPGAWQAAVEDADLIFNLAGKTIFHRWTRKYKKEIHDSRILTTRNVVAAMAKGARQTLVSTSAVGYYGESGETELTENSPNGKDFLAVLSKDWEAEAMAAAAKDARVVIARFGIIMGKEGGALPTMLTAFRSFVGGPMGSGRQWVSWVHVLDLIAALDFLAGRSDLSGPFNLCAPNPVRNKEMSALIAASVHRPDKIAVPAMALRMMMGEMAEMLLNSQRVMPQRLLKAGFVFRHPLLDEALENLLKA